MRLILDTNTLNFILKGRPQVLDRAKDAEARGANFLLAPVVHYELMRYLNLKGAARLARAYERLTSTWHRLDFSAEDWDSAARLWAERHRAGKAVSDFDLFLVVLARREEAVVVTNNTRHFEGLGVELEDWTLPG